MPKHVVYRLNAELNPICHLLALLGAHHILHVSRIKVKHSTSTKCWVVIDIIFIILVYKSVSDMNEVFCETIQGADKSLARPGREQATATEDFEFHITYL